ncbi:MAG: hypothetical protein KatS3mg105_4482 [Gemmatales bacterium]|nr:MAG: hypothetical protein KatS3mg105_4482 [Gemmatales bacterium]
MAIFPSNDDASPPTRSIFFVGFWFEMSLGLAAIGAGWLFGYPTLKLIRWQMDAVGWGLLACAPMLLVFCVTVAWPIGPFAGLERISQEIIRPLFESCTLWQSGLVVARSRLGVKSCSSVVCCSRFSSTGWVVVPAFLISNLLFGLLHPLTFTYFVLATIMGYFLSYVVFLTDNLLPVILAHGIYDFVALIYVVKFMPARPVAEEFGGEVCSD